jgi:uncharacterized membrane protein YfcA
MMRLRSSTRYIFGHLCFQLASVDWHLNLAVTVLAIAGSLADARVARRIFAQLLRTGFGWFLTAASMLVLLQKWPP